MKRLALVAALVLALTGGAARADVFAVSPSSASAPLVLPSADTPNSPGSLLLPAAWTQQTPLPAKLEYGQLQTLWQRAGAAYGIRWQVLAAINKIESNFGRNMGPSSAGAVGWMQFMPDTWLRWGTDANGDGVADPWTAEDAIYSAARYLAASGAQTDLRRSVFAYNHADWYVNEVLALAQTYSGGGPEVVFTLDRLQLAVDDARRQTVAANEGLLVATSKARRRAAAESR